MHLLPLLLYAAAAAAYIAHFAWRDPRGRPAGNRDCSAAACSRTHS